MKIRVLEKDDRSMRFEIIGEGHTFCNLLRETLLEDEDVEFAAYKVDHPLVSNPVFYVRTTGVKPEEALKRATKAMISKLEEFKRTFSEAFKS
ncbi:MAG: DNA-directed RNA polymerase subunit L [Thermoprotei archaeon]|nr:MAG: DNA-directed RNA polymerase subunit L [Thermoprotei archaeon]RLF22708.1 MAG: DNA-directed RNA polymerase subunit L [Thermoprotei archaeon]